MPCHAVQLRDQESVVTYVSAYRNEAKVERSSKVTNFFEGGAVWVDVLFTVVIDTLG